MAPPIIGGRLYLPPRFWREEESPYFPVNFDDFIKN